MTARSLYAEILVCDCTHDQYIMTNVSNCAILVSSLPFCVFALNLMFQTVWFFL